MEYEIRVNMDEKNKNPVNRRWQSASAQSSIQGDDETGKSQNQTKNPTAATCSAALAAQRESLISKDVKQLVRLVKHSKSMEIGQSLMRFVIGKGGSTLKEIEMDTGVKVIIPSSRKEDCITIEGTSTESVAAACEKIQSIIDKAVNSRALDYSHFVSLPLAIHPKLVDKLLNFQNSVLELKNDDELKNDGAAESSSSRFRDLGIEKSIFINPKTFHLTLLMLKLWNKQRVDAASEVLQSVSTMVLDALDNRTVSIKLKGLECMKGSFAKCGVLYLPVEEIGGEGQLMRAIQVIVDAFINAGLVIEQDLPHKLKLHATIMNVRNRRKNPRQSQTFDARGIAARYGSEDWGKYHILEAHLSERFVYDANGYYHCCASIPFPDNGEKEDEVDEFV